MLFVYIVLHKLRFDSQFVSQSPWNGTPSPLNLYPQILLKLQSMVSGAVPNNGGLKQEETLLAPACPGQPPRSHTKAVGQDRSFLFFSVASQDKSGAKRETIR